MRNKHIRSFSVASGQATAPETREVETVAFGGVHVSAGLDGSTLKFYDLGDWGRDLVLEKTVATGWNPFTDAEARSIGPSVKLQMEVTTGGEPASDSTVWLKLKS